MVMITALKNLMKKNKLLLILNLINFTILGHGLDHPVIHRVKLNIIAVLLYLGIY